MLRPIAPCILLLLATASFAQVTTKSILQESIDMNSLTHRPSPYYKAAQASSYDRRTVSKGTDDWFANGDAGQFVRVENVDGRTERVMADLTGPGAVTRIWSANPGGTIRFYFDGETTPRWSALATDLLSGKVAPFKEPFAYVAARGWNLYAPLPYAKSLKITVDDSDGDKSKSMYYHVGYRTYDAGTEVQTFDPASLDAEMIGQIGRAIGRPYTPLYNTVATRKRLPALGNLLVKLPAGPRAVSYFTVSIQREKPRLKRNETDPLIVKWDDPRQMHNMLRKVQVEMDFDGETCVRAPLGDFFGAMPALDPYDTFAMGVKADGTMVCRFAMPYSKSAQIRLRNTSDVNVIASYFAETLPYTWTDNSYHFKAQWNGEHGRTRPFRDMTFLDTKGEGLFVGDNMLISNPSPGWWGEGDEKIYVDGEAFPSTIGTGTEDYYGYAWSNPEAFMRPYHAQPHTEPPSNFGHSEVMRFHIMDPYPFQTSLQFDMEMWHWQDVEATFVHTAYWYAKPGSGGPVKIDQRLTKVYELVRPKPVEGALEGENLEIVSKSGGETEKQGGFWQTSGETQLWWRDGKPGDKLLLKLPVKESGKFLLTGRFCVAPDYGMAKISLDGRELKSIDFYSKGLDWRTLDFGTVDLIAGDHQLEIEITGANPAAEKRFMFGLDYVKLDKKK